MRFWKKIMTAMAIASDLATIKLLWPYVETTAESEFEQLKARLKRRAAEDAQVGAFWEAVERVIERI